MSYNLPVDYKSLSWIERKKFKNSISLNKRTGVCIMANFLLKNHPKRFGKRKYPVHLQHDHHTGTTEEAVYSLCNAFM